MTDKPDTPDAAQVRAENAAAWEKSQDYERTATWKCSCGAEHTFRHWTCNYCGALRGR